MTTFRVHTTAGSVDVPAENPTDARKAVEKANPDVKVIKVKLLKGGEA